MINLISREDQNLKRNARIAKWVKLGTTVVLLVYLVSIVGLSSRWVTLFNKEREQSQEEKMLVGKLASLAQTEILLRQVDERARLVNQTVKNRIELAPRLSKLVGMLAGKITLVDWTYNESGEQSLTVNAETAANIESLTDRLKNQYKSVKLTSLQLTAGQAWLAKLTVVDGL